MTSTPPEIPGDQLLREADDDDLTAIVARLEGRLDHQPRGPGR
jgi:hypothetical protein